MCVKFLLAERQHAHFEIGQVDFSFQTKMNEFSGKDCFHLVATDCTFNEFEFSRYKICS